MAIFPVLENQRLTRRGLMGSTMAVALAAFALTGHATDASAQTQLRVGKSNGDTFAFLPVDIGEKVGIFEKNGLKLTITDFGGGARLQQGLTAGAIDIGLGSGPQMNAIPLGAPVKAVAMFMGPPAMLVLMGRPDGTVKNADDLKGKKVAVTQLSALTAWLARRIAIEKGWGPQGVELVAAGNDDARIAALRTKQVDAIVITPETALKLERSKQGLIVARFTEYVKHFHNHVIFATNDSIEKQPDAVRAFVKGWFETIKWMRENKAKTVEMMMQMLGDEKDIAEKVYDEAMPAFSLDGKFEAEALNVLAESWVETGALKSKPDVSTLYTEAFLPK